MAILMFYLMGFDQFGHASSVGSVGFYPTLIDVAPSGLGCRYAFLTRNMRLNLLGLGQAPLTNDISFLISCRKHEVL